MEDGTWDAPMDHQAFVGHEGSKHQPPMLGVMASEPHGPWVTTMLHMYDDRRFLLNENESTPESLQNYTKVSDTNLHNIEPDFILGGRKESIEKAIEIANARSEKQELGTGKFDREEWNARHAAWLATKFDCTAWLTWFIENYPQSEKAWRENREAMRKNSSDFTHWCQTPICTRGQPLCVNLLSW